MKPVKLSMQAFGPYREREMVDFAELGPNRVFLIHGDTGSGKTTILDAMVFALYGDTSGGERRADQMRCESAAPDLPTEVAFDFALGPKSYRIRRRPAQQLMGPRSATPVSKQAEVAVWERTGCDSSEEGRPLALRIREADALVRGLLGFSCEQFRQVVILPQGRFRELLSSGSDKREEILRQLFRTERFRDLEAALLERAKLVRKEMERLTVEREAQLGLVGVADDTDLAASIERVEGEVESTMDRVKEQEAAAQAAVDALTVAETVEEARRSVAAARKDVEALESRSAEIAAMQGRLEAGLRADKVRPTADRLSDGLARLQEVLATRAKADHELAAGLDAERAAVERLAAENERLPERRAAAERVRQLEALTVALVGLREAESAANSAAARAASAKAAAEEAGRALQQAHLRAEELSEVVGRGRAAAARIEGARAQLDQARQVEDRCRRLVEAGVAVAAAGERRAALAAAEADCLRGYELAESALGTAEELWRSGRAVALAAGLRAGEPCPVCGSIEHPAPASGAEGGVADEQLDASRAAAAAARETYDRSREAAAASGSELAAAQVLERSILQELGLGPRLSRGEAKAAVETCTAELETLEEQAGLAGREGELEDAGRRVAEAAAAAETARDAVIEEERGLARAEARLAERAAGIPEDLKEEGPLGDALAEARGKERELEAKFAEARERAAETKEGRIALQTSAERAVEAQKEAEGHEGACREMFREALRAHGFAGEEYWQRHLLLEPELATLELDLKTYQEALHQAKGRLQQAETGLATQPEPGNLAYLRSAAEEARLEHGRAIGRHSDARAALERLIGVRERLAEIDRKSEDVRRAYQTVGVLADVANGQNPSRVSFQRWVLGVYLDEVLATASRKLYAMSKGRYQLERQREAAGWRRASGLDIAVFDEFSGRSRPAVTLSGGESFLAALALALGLAETVQAHSAGTPLETIFVDEGFGALDPDALELAVEALMELQLSGRLVGVISHVPELRQVIPARLEVRGGSDGSRTRFVVP